jgi:hypothetical protein
MFVLRSDKTRFSTRADLFVSPKLQGSVRSLTALPDDSLLSFGGLCLDRFGGEGCSRKQVSPHFRLVQGGSPTESPFFLTGFNQPCGDRVSMHQSGLVFLASVRLDWEWREGNWREGRGGGVENPGPKSIGLSPALLPRSAVSRGRSQGLIRATPRVYPRSNLTPQHPARMGRGCSTKFRPFTPSPFPRTPPR